MHMSPATLLSSACLSALLVGGLHAQTAELSAVTCIGAESVFSSTSYPINSKASTNTIVASPLGSQATWSSPLPGDCPFKA